jgi:integrase/recombinase XerC
MQNTTTGAFLAVEQFIEELRVVRKLSPHTLKAYRQDLKTLCNFLTEYQLDLHQMKSSHTRGWVSKLHSMGNSPRSIARLLSAWRTFFDWLVMSKTQLSIEEITLNPLQDLRAPRKAKNLPKALSVEFAIALMEKAQAETKQPIPESLLWVFQRDHALVELLYSSGLRISEILGIDCSTNRGYAKESSGWIAWESQEVHVLGKGNKPRIVPIGSAAMGALHQWFSIWQIMLDQQKVSDAPLFINAKLQRLSPRTVQERMKGLAMRAGLPVHVHPHMLRHSFASHVLQSSHDLRAVQEMLGHASIGSTQIYTALDFQQLAQVYDLAHPRAKVNK